MNYEEIIQRLNNLKNIDFIEGKDLKALDIAIEVLDKQLNDKWIPVSERLPRKDSYVLVSLDNGLVMGAEFDNFGDWFKWGSKGKVVAWKPMITGYKK